MKIKRFSKAMACVLSACMIFSSFTIAASAASDYKSETHDVFKHTESTLAPGVEQSINYAYAKDGKQMVYYVATADISRDDVEVHSSYKDAQCQNFGMDKLTNQMAAADAKYTNPDYEHYNPYFKAVVGTNGDFYNMTTGRPSGAFVMDGIMSSSKANNRPFFAVMEDGTALCGANNAQWDAAVAAHGKVMEAVGGSQMLVVDGKDVTASASGSYNTDRHSRTMVGVTADGKVVMTVLDGRQEPFSCGGSMHELAQIMLEQGCVSAINLDGGGSTTFAARPEGETDVRVINRPSDGSERSISSGLLIASTAVPSDTFDRAVLTADNNYVTPGSTVNVSAVGVSPAGTSAEIPADVTYSATLGTITADGKFTSDGTTGAAKIQMLYNGDVVGETTVNVVIPDSLEFTQSQITVPYGKTVELDMVAKYGLNEVALKPADVKFTLENETAATLNGFNLTACAGDITGTGITAVLVQNEAISSTAQLVFGKGSEIVESFENYTIPSSAYIKTGYPQYGPAGANGQNEKGSIEIVDSSSGKVHSGEKSLAVNCDFSQLYETGYHLLNYNFGTKTFKIPANATAFGFWMYVPQDTEALYMRPLIDTNGDGSSDYNPDIISTGLASTYIEEGWHYYNIDMSHYNSMDSSFYCIQIYVSDRDGSSYNYYFKNQYSVDSKFTLYIDDITYDYSSVVDDREAPQFTSVRYADRAMSDAEELNNQTVNDSVISFGAIVHENTSKNNYTGLNAATAKAYIDGIEVESKYSGGTISVQDAQLADGVHTVSFEIADNAGNLAKIHRNITISANSDLTYVNLVPQTPNANKIPIGSIQWYDLKTNAVESIKNIKTVLNLNSVSNWELEGMTVADGFKADYSVNKVTNDATITITKTDEVNATGEAVIASIPVRTWVSTITNDPGYETSTPQSLWSRKIIWPKDIKLTADYGMITFADDTTGSFASTTYQTITELYGNYAALNANGDYANKKSWHTHTAEAIADKAASCTESGYTGRTYCAGCNSVVDWGTTVPAAGHTYEVIDGVLKCKDCDELFNGEYTDGKTYFDGVVANGLIDGKYYVDGVIANNYICIDGVYYVVENGVKGSVYTGLVQKDGKWCYSKLGNLTGGWISIDNDWYYFDSKTFEAVNTLNNGKVTFSFEDNGKLISGQWYKTSAGCRYYYGPSYYSHGWHNIDGYDYYFGDANVETGYRYEGLRYVINSNSHTPQWYDFGTDGKAVKLDMTGLLTVSDKQYYLVNGISQTGLQLIDGKYYYFSGTYESKKGIVYVSSVKSNSLLPEGYYLFKDNYQMADEEFGIWQNKTRYIRKGQPCFAGLILNEEGKINYIGSDCCLATGICTIPNNKTNGLLPEGTYAFGIDGTLVDNNFAMWQGNMCYMRNGQPYAAGLVRIDNDIYYIRSNCQVATGIYWVSENKTNEVLESGFYLFDTDGTLVNGKFGDWNGNTYYIKNGQPFFAGVIEYEGKIVYVGSDCKMNTGVCYITSANGNGILTEGYYFFSEDGSLLDNGFGKWTDGNTYYFRNGQRCPAGAVEIDGSIYYINSGCRPVTGKYYVSANKGNGILSEGYYTFDSDGSLISK